MEKQQVNKEAASEKPVKAKLPYISPSLVELDTALTENGQSIDADGNNSANVSI